MIANKKVLLLNYTYEPLAVVSARRAIKKLVSGANILVEELSDSYISFGNGRYQIPSVIRLGYYVKLPKRKRSGAKKRKVLARDNYTCVYCQVRLDNTNFSVDHVIPKAHGGDSHPSNLVASCRQCNSKKGTNYLEPIIKVARNANIDSYLLFKELMKHDNWAKYLPFD